MTHFDQEKFEPIQVESIEVLPDQIQAEIITDSFSAISNEYNPIDRNQINIPTFHSDSIPVFYPYQVKRKLEKVKENKASVPGDIPACIIKKLTTELSVPLANIINTCIKNGRWPKLYKTESITPIPKKFPPSDVSMLRPISLLYFFERIIESLIGELMIDDTKNNIDEAQFGNKKKTSINHYLVKMLNRIVTCLDDNSKGSINAVLCLFIYYHAAFSRMCHILGVNSFIKNGVRPSLVPCLISYYEDREMHVRWHGQTSTKRKMPGSGAMGATFGILEFISQTNSNADNIPIEDRIKYFDDVSILEEINLVSIELTSYNVKNQVPSDLPLHGQYIHEKQLLSSKYLNELNVWSEDHQNCDKPK